MRSKTRAGRDGDFKNIAHGFSRILKAEGDYERLKAHVSIALAQSTAVAKWARAREGVYRGLFGRAIQACAGCPEACSVAGSLRNLGRGRSGADRGWRTAGVRNLVTLMLTQRGERANVQNEIG